MLCAHLVDQWSAQVVSVACVGHPALHSGQLARFCEDSFALCDVSSLEMVAESVGPTLFAARSAGSEAVNWTSDLFSETLSHCALVKTHQHIKLVRHHIITHHTPRRLLLLHRHIRFHRSLSSLRLYVPCRPQSSLADCLSSHANLLNYQRRRRARHSYGPLAAEHGGTTSALFYLYKARSSWHSSPRAERAWTGSMGSV